MATVIDALIVTLGLDSKQFTAAAKKTGDTQEKISSQANKASKQREAEDKKAAAAKRKEDSENQKRAKDSVKGFSDVRNEVLKLLTVFTAGVGIADFFTGTIGNAVSLGYLSENLGTTTEQLSAWERASERAGGTAQGMAAQFKESADTLAALRSGLGPTDSLQWFFRAGGSTVDLKDGNTYLLARAKIIKQLFDVDPTKASLIARQMGISEDQFNFIKQGPEAILALVAAQEKNSAITKKNAKDAKDLQNAFLDLRDDLTATATRILLQLTPSIKDLFEWLAKGAVWISEHKKDISNWVDSGVAGLKEFVKEANSVADALGGWANVLKILAAIKVVTALSSIAGGIGGITSALKLLTAGGGIPALLLAIGALSAYAGYKGAEYLFGDKQKPVDQKPMGLRKKADLRAEASRERVEAGLSPLPNLAGNDASSVRDKLVKMGWSPEQSAGITGSFMQESSLDPNATNTQSGAYGIGQWLAPRRADFKKWSGHDIKGSSLDEQLAFFQFEVTQGKEKAAGAKLRAASTADDAAKVHAQSYERPGADEANIPRRQQLAEQIAASTRQDNAIAIAQTPSGAPASLTNDNSKTSTSTSTTTVGTINVNTQATDAPGIAAAIGPSVEKYSSSMQANSGLK